MKQFSFVILMLTAGFLWLQNSAFAAIEDTTAKCQPESVTPLPLSDTTNITSTLPSTNNGQSPAIVLISRTPFHKTGKRAAAAYEAGKRGKRLHIQIFAPINALFEREKTKAFLGLVKAQLGNTLLVFKTALGPKDIPLTLTFSNLVSPTAPLMIGLYGKENRFLDINDQLRHYRLVPHGKKLTIRIKDIEYGEFAVAVYQDLNSDGKINKNFLGIPTEPYAFSNNYRPTFMPPTFSNCKFEYNSKLNCYIITM